MPHITRIVVHCSDSPHGQGITAEDVHRWHSEPPPNGNGWSGIGYHYVIEENGTVTPGRPEYWQGAHAKGYNKDSLGLCVMGRDDTEFNGAQLMALRGLYDHLTQKYPQATWFNHYDLNPGKTCPGFDAVSWLHDPDGSGMAA